MSTLPNPRDPGLLGWVTGRERQCALIGAFTIAFSSILVRLSHASPSTAAIFRCVYALPILLALSAVERRRFGPRPARARRASLVAGVFFAADLLLWHHSIGDVGAGLSTVLANVQVVLVPLVAWALLAERPAATVLGALPVSLLGVLLISARCSASGPAWPTSGSCSCCARAGLTCAARLGHCVTRLRSPPCCARSPAWSSVTPIWSRSCRPPGG